MGCFAEGGWEWLGRMTCLSVPGSPAPVLEPRTKNYMDDLENLST